jgi:hypothetical protein
MNRAYVFDFIWGLCVIASWAGWGSLLRRILRISDRRSADWGIRAGWGAAVTIAIGGVLNLCRISTQPVVIAVVLIGLFSETVGSILCFRHWFWRYRFRRSSPLGLRQSRIRRLVPAILFIGPCVVALAFLYAGSVHLSWGLNPYDDYLAYMVFPIRMLQTGTLIEPFSLRRLGTFGGHAFLTAMVFSGSSADMAWALEMGICPIVIGGLIYGFLRPHTAREFFFAGLLIIISFITYVPHANTMSSATGTMLFLTLFRTLALENSPPIRRSRIGWVTVIVVAAVSTLRVNFLVAAFAALVLSRLFSTSEQPAVQRLRNAAIDCAKACAFILPWSILLFISSGTFLWPLMKGNERNFDTLFRTDTGPLALLRWIGEFLSARPVPVLLAPLALPIIFPPFRRSGNCRAALFIAGAGFFATVITVAGSSPAVSFGKDVYRFTFPILFSLSLAMLMTMTTALFFIRKSVPSFVAALALLAYSYRLGKPHYLWALNIVGMGMPPPSVAIFSPQQTDYHDLQYSVPKGASLLAILNYPNLLDYRRNKIYNADLLLPYGPYPGTPLFKGPDAMKHYLRSLHIEYVAAVDFDQDRISWYSRPNDANSVIYSNPIFFVYKPYFFDYMQNIDAIERQNQVLFRRDGIRVFRLSE